jgi:sugar/nucleoside kinase (ribokinase family)
MVGVGGIGSGMFLALEGDRTLGRSESRGAHLLDVRDYCKLHIIAHHIAVLTGADPSGTAFRVVPVGTVGDDETGRRMVTEMAAVGIDTSFVETVADRPTLFSVCFQYPDGSGGNITTADSAAAALDERDVERAAPLLAADGGRAIALAVPEVGLGVRRRLLQLATGAGAFRAASFVSSEMAEARDSGMFELIDLVSINEDEGEVLTGRSLDPADPLPFLEAIGSAVGDVEIVVSAGSEGAFARSGGRWAHRAALPVAVVTTAGAGDALLAGVLAALSAGVPLLAPLDADPAADEPALASALDLGLLLAARSVTSPHTIHPAADLGTLIAFAGGMGLSFAPPLGDVV